MRYERNTWQNFDFVLFELLLLSIIGIALIRSSIAGNIELVDHPQRQTIFLLISLGVLFAIGHRLSVLDHLNPSNVFGDIWAFCYLLLLALKQGLVLLDGWKWVKS